MAFQRVENKLDEFLAETEYCDFKKPEILELSQKLTREFDNPKKKAITLFYWVRDNIHYRVGLWTRRASETLVEKSGSCTNNANLLVALLRASNIPAAYGVMRVDGPEFMGPVIIPSLRKKISKSSVHIYAQVYLNGKWIKCDPSTDIYLSQKTSHFNPQSKLVDWDGENDSLQNLDPSHILEDKNLLPNIDKIISKKSKKGMGIVIRIANLYIKFLRNNEKITKHPSELEYLFKSWLKRHSPRHYYLFAFNSFWHDFKSRFKK